MRGITEEQLIAYAEMTDHPHTLDALNELLDNCKEINPWLPIDENTPRDRYILLYCGYVTSGKYCGAREEWLDTWAIQ